MRRETLLAEGTGDRLDVRRVATVVHQATKCRRRSLHIDLLRLGGGQLEAPQRLLRQIPGIAVVVLGGIVAGPWKLAHLR